MRVRTGRFESHPKLGILSRPRYAVFMASHMPGECAANHQRRMKCDVCLAAVSWTPMATCRGYAVVPRFHCLTCKSRSRLRIDTGAKLEEA